MIIACIGSRKITEKQKKICIAIGYFLAKLGHSINSGNAEGADCHFAIGANAINPELVNLYLTDKNHNPQFVQLGNSLYYENQFPEWEELAKIHPKYNSLKPYVKKLMNRNAGIILNCDLCIAMPNEKVTGGTAHSMKIAQSLNKPIINLNYDLEKVVAILSK